MKEKDKFEPSTHMIIYNYETNNCRTIKLNEKIRARGYQKVFEGTFMECNALRKRLGGSYSSEQISFRSKAIL